MTFLKGRKGIVLVLVAALIAGGALRFIGFHDLLRFELDQARDARIIDDGLRGDFFDLPLLGPRAGGTYLRLPPAFYSLQYGSALLFGQSPSGMAFFIPILSLLSIVTFYLFLRQYFAVGIALGLSGIFSVSTFLVLYGRFAWNPNPLPFFLLLGFLALLKATSGLTRYPGWWLALSAVALGLATQLHFLAFVSIPLITIAYLVYRRPCFSWQAWVGGALIVVALYAPVALNEIETGGRNAQEFVKAVTGKSGKGDHPLLNKLVKNVLEQAAGTAMLISGSEKAELPNFKTKPALDIICDGGCRAGLWMGLTSLTFIAGGIFLLVFRLVRRWKSEAGPRRDFLALVLLWYGAVVAVLTPLAFGYSPRFFLLLAPLPFVLLGLWAEAILEYLGRFRVTSWILLVFTLGLVASNLFFTTERLTALARGATEPVQIDGPDRILKDKARVTLGQQETIVDHMEVRSRETGHPVFMFSEPQHRRALKYLLEKRGVQNAVLGFDGLYREGVYFLILRTRSNLEDGTRKYRVNYNEIDRREFGTLTLFEFRPKPELDIPERKDWNTVAPSGEDSRWAPRYTWREWWHRQGVMAEEDESLDQE